MHYNDSVPYLPTKKQNIDLEKKIHIIHKDLKNRDCLRITSYLPEENLQSQLKYMTYKDYETSDVNVEHTQGVNRDIKEYTK